MASQSVIYIPVESKKREFDGKIMLAAALLERGWRVVIGTKAGIHRETLHHRGGLYLAKSISNDFLDYYKKLKERDYHLVVLDVEGGALTREIRNDLLRSYQEESVPYFDYFYVFGDKITEALDEYIPYIPHDKIVVTGEPRFDLLKPSHQCYDLEDKQAILSRYSRFVLINTSFGLANSVLGEEGIRHFLETTGDIPEEQRPLYLLKHREGKFLLQSFIQLSRYLAERFPELNLVLRPHPDEDLTVYTDALGGYRNVFVANEGSVHPWIKASVAVIHPDCTTGLEAVLAGKYAISYLPRAEESITAWLPVYVSMACTTPEEVGDTLRQVLAEEGSIYFPGNEKEEVLASYFLNYKAEASLTLADHLSAHFPAILPKTIQPIKLLIKRIRSRINIIRLRQKVKRDGWDRFIRVNKSEVRAKLRRTGFMSVDSAVKSRIRGGNVIDLVKR
jgi:surface carbohydrate biosynthesis protein